MTKLLGFIIGTVEEGIITVSLGNRYGLANGQGTLKVDLRLVDQKARMPNTRAWVVFDEKTIVTAVTALSPEENIEEERWENRET